jgi:hypothetical protein
MISSDRDGQSGQKKIDDLDLSLYYYYLIS